MTDTRSFSSSSSLTSNNANNTANSVSSAVPDADKIQNLTAYINTVFHQMEERFMAANDEVMNRMNELGKRIDSLESNIGDIISHLPATDSNVNADATVQQTKT